LKTHLEDEIFSVMKERVSAVVDWFADSGMGVESQQNTSRTSSPVYLNLFVRGERGRR